MVLGVGRGVGRSVGEAAAAKAVITVSPMAQIIFCSLHPHTSHFFLFTFELFTSPCAREEKTHSVREAAHVGVSG